MGNHRAARHTPVGAAGDSTPVAGTRSTGGRRRATRHQTNFFRSIPAVPTIVGAVALVAAAGAAVGLGPGQLPASANTNLQLSSGSVDAFSGTDAFNFTSTDPRSKAISRDSERQALKAAADQDLKDAVEEQSAQRNAALATLAKSAQARADQLAKNVWVLPTSAYRLTARFGQSSGLWSNTHTGLDFAAPSGTPIYAIGNGVVTESGFDGAYGYKTVQTLADGTEIWYCHQSEISVQVGEKLIQGDQIGRVGSTGNVTGPHLHLEVRPGGGDPVDPFPAFVFHGITP